MVTTISPVVHRGYIDTETSWVTAATFYTAGSIIGGILTGALAGGVGLAIALIFPFDERLLALVLAIVAAGYSLHELSFVALPHPERKRQVPSHWRHQFHPYITASAYGLLLGLGFITFIPTTAFYILILATLAYASPVVGMIIFACYGAGRALLLWLVGPHIRTPERPYTAVQYLDLTKPLIRQANGFVLAMAGTYLICTYL